MDKLNIYPRERPYSPDIMDMQAMISRVVADLMQFQHSNGFNANSALATNNVCYGLAVTSNAATGLNYVTMNPGVLLQHSSTLAPLPGTLDSSYRIGFNRNQLPIYLPTPGSATWYLLEAQVADVSSATELRDIMDVLTGQFKATSVSKRTEGQVSASLATWKAGTSTQIPTPSFGDWVPICACLVQAGGTIAASTDFIDMRPVAKVRVPETRQGWSRSPTVPVLRTVASPTAPANWGIKIAVAQAITNQDVADTEYGGGLELLVADNNVNLNSVDPRSAAVAENGLVTAASTWYYLYLCPWYDIAPDNSRQGVAHTRGVLVLSATPPEGEGLFNSAAITLPAPFGNYPVPAYQAPCVGALRSNASNNGWDPMAGGNGTFSLVPYTTYNSCYFTSATAINAVPQSLIPANAKLLTWVHFVTMTGAGAEVDAVGFGDTGSVYATQWATALHALGSGDPDQYAATVTAPRAHCAQSLFHQLTVVRAFSSKIAVLIGYTT